MLDEYYQISMAHPQFSSVSGTFDPGRDDIIDYAGFYINLVLLFVCIYLFMCSTLLLWLFEKENKKKEYFRLRDIELGRLMQPARENITVEEKRLGQKIYSVADFWGQ